MHELEGGSLAGVSNGLKSSPPSLNALSNRVAARVLDAPDSSDFLGWHAGTMEYWVHAIVAAEARRLGAWSAHTEVPYLTRAQVASKQGEKWSDGVVVWPDGHGTLVEAKAVVAHSVPKALGDLRNKVPADLDALLGIDWAATLERNPGKYEDSGWAERRGSLHKLYALQIVVVHGGAALECLDQVPIALRDGVTRVASSYSASPPWLARLQQAYVDGALVERARGDGPNASAIFAWAVPIWG